MLLVIFGLGIGIALFGFMIWRSYFLLILTLLFGLMGSLAHANSALINTGILGGATMVRSFVDSTEMQIRRSTVRVASTMSTRVRSADRVVNAANCSGVLVRRRIVLTAAHCIFTEVRGQSQRVTVWFFNPNRPTEVVSRIRATRYVKNPEVLAFAGRPHAVFENDLAVLFLSEDAPESYTPVPVAFVDLNFSSLNAVPRFTFGGYGIVQENEDDTNVLADQVGSSFARHAVGNERIAFNIRYPVGAFPQAPKQESAITVAYSDFSYFRLVQTRATGLLRGGDSGGPMFIAHGVTGQLYVAGTVAAVSRHVDDDGNAIDLPIADNEEFIFATNFSDRYNRCFLAGQIGVAVRGCTP